MTFTNEQIVEVIQRWLDQVSVVAPGAIPSDANIQLYRIFQTISNLRIAGDPIAYDIFSGFFNGFLDSIADGDVVSHRTIVRYFRTFADTLDGTRETIVGGPPATITSDANGDMLIMLENGLRTMMASAVAGNVAAQNTLRDLRNYMNTL